MTTEERLERLERELNDLVHNMLDAVRRALPSTGGTKPEEGNRIILAPDRPEKSLAFTRIDEGRFGGEFANNWNALVRVGIRAAVRKGYGISALRRCGDLPVREGSKTDEGYSPVRGTNLSVRGLSANDSWRSAYALAKALNCEISVDFHWRDKDRAAHRNHRGRLRWSPETRAGSPSPTPLYPGRRPGPSGLGRHG